VTDPHASEVATPLQGTAGRTEYPRVNRADDFEQDARARVVANIAGHLGKASRDVQRRQLSHFVKADPDYGARVADALKLDPREAT